MSPGRGCDIGPKDGAARWLARSGLAVSGGLAVWFAIGVVFHGAAMPAGAAVQPFDFPRVLAALFAGFMLLMVSGGSGLRARAWTSRALITLILGAGTMMVIGVLAADRTGGSGRPGVLLLPAVFIAAAVGHRYTRKAELGEIDGATAVRAERIVGGFFVAIIAVTLAVLWVDPPQRIAAAGGMERLLPIGLMMAGLGVAAMWVRRGR